MRALLVVLALAAVGCSPSGEAKDSLRVLYDEGDGHTLAKFCDGTTAIYVVSGAGVSAVANGCAAKGR